MKANRLEVGQIVYGRMNSSYKVISIDTHETRTHINDRYTLKGQKICAGSAYKLWLVPSDIGKLVFTEKRTDEQIERFLDTEASEF